MAQARKSVEGARNLAQFGYVVNRLESTPNGKFVCAEDVLCGSPLLALPLHACWTKKAVSVECPKIASALQAGIEKFPFSALMKADATWIALHMMYELRQADNGRSVRQAYLKTLPEKLSTLIAWSYNDLLSLEGSRWKLEAERSKRQMLEDFETLRLELGDLLGADSSKYCWAIAAVQEFGTQVMGENGSPFTVIAPGLNLMTADECITPPRVGGIRVESTTLSNQPTLALYAVKDYSAGEGVTLLHAGLACSTGCRLMHCGKFLADNSCESVELELTLPVDMMPRQKSTVASILEGLAVLFTDGVSPPTPGEGISPDPLGGELPVDMVDRNGVPMLRIFVQFSTNKLVPSAKGLVTLGTVLAYDSSTQAQLEFREAGRADILGPVACQRRALEYLWRVITERSSNKQGDNRIVAAEMKILRSALQEIGRVLGSLDTVGIEPSLVKGSLLDDLKSAGDNPAKDSVLETALQALRNCTTASEAITATFQKRPTQTQGTSLVWELELLCSSLRRCPLGDPMAMQCLPVLEGSNAASRTFKEVAAAMRKAFLEAGQWECASASKPTDNATRMATAASLVKVAQLQMHKLRFHDALENLKKSIVLSAAVEAMKLAGECLIAMTAPSQSVLHVKWEDLECEQAFTLLRQNLRNVGYTNPGSHWSFPTRLPGVIKFAGKTEMSEGPLADAFRLFMTHETVPLGSMVELVGYKASRLLLSCGAVTCFNAANMEIIKSADAPALVNKKPDKPLSVFSNIMLWPVQENLLVAIDFDQLTPDVQQFDPVPFLAQDSRVLMLSAPRAKASMVLDVDCGSGAQGLIALKNYAQTAVFLDSNPRALRFARFSAHLNGLGKRATFVAGCLDTGVPQELKGKTFDVILACPTCLPIPDAVSTNGGSTLTRGGPDGQKVLGALVKRSAGLLSQGGRFVATAILPNPDNFAERLQGWLEGSGVNATVLHGEHLTATKFESSASAGSSLPSAFAFADGLKQQEVKSVAQAVLMLWKATEATSDFPIDLRSEHLGLWSDDMYVASELQAALDQLQLTLGPGQQLYALEWEDNDNEPEQPLALPSKAPPGKDTREVESCWAAMRKPASVQNGRLASLIQPKVSKEPDFPVVDGATWKDLPFVQMFGYPLPCLMDQLWRKVEIPLGTHFPPNAHAPEGETRIPPTNFSMALVELESCGPVPDLARDAVNSLNCYDQLSFEAVEGDPQKHLQKKHFGGWRKKLKDGETPPNMLERYDTLVLAFGEQAGADAATLPRVMREFLDYVSAWVEKKNVAIRVVVLTCGANGPTFPDGPPEEMLHRAAPLRGLFRCARQEVEEVPILSIDTDQMGASGDAEELADQLSRELEAYTPDVGLEDASPEEFSEAVYKTHREVAWRKGERFFPGLNPAARNPINVNINLDHLKLPAEGVVLITGGSGGLGVVTAEALVECGVRCVVLASRSGRLGANQGLEERVAKMEKMGAKVVLMGGCDTAKEDSVLSMLENTRQYGQLRYVFHAAGIFDVDVDKVFGPKVNAAWWLHKYTLQDNLDAFVCFASMTECLGTPGMSGYAQANTYMEELCRYRHALGLSGTAVQFPEVQGVGMASGASDAASIDNSIISQVMKVITAGSAPIGPVISILTFGFMLPRAPISHIYHEPLLRRVNAGLWQRLNALEATIGGKKMRQLRDARHAKMQSLKAVTDAGAYEGQE